LLPFNQFKTVVELAPLISIDLIVKNSQGQVLLGKIAFDVSKPDGAPRKLMNVERLKSLGWE